MRQAPAGAGCQAAEPVAETGNSSGLRGGAGMALPDRSARSRRGLRGRRRLRRQLAGIADGLAKDARLTAKFAMFNALTKGEPVSGAEPLPQLRLPEFGWPLTLLFARNRRARNRPARKLATWQGRVIAIAAMAAIITGTLLLSSLLRPTARTCLMLASSGTQASAAPSKAAQPAQTLVPGEPAGGFVRGPGSTCPAIPAKK